MVLGFLKKRKDKKQLKASTGDFTQQVMQEPIGEWTEDGYIPDPRELSLAIPLPEYALLCCSYF